MILAFSENENRLYDEILQDICRNRKVNFVQEFEDKSTIRIENIEILSISFAPGQKKHPGDAFMASPGCYHQRYSLQRYFRSKSSIQRGLSYRYPWIISIFIWSRAFSCLGSSTPSTTTFTSMVPARSETVLMKASEN